MYIIFRYVHFFFFFFLDEDIRLYTIPTVKFVYTYVNNICMIIFVYMIFIYLYTYARLLSQILQSFKIVMLQT